MRETVPGGQAPWHTQARSRGWPLAPRGRGVARALYGRLIALAREQGVPLVAAEADIAPVYNGPSLRMHASLGFREVGTKPHGDVTVSLQELDLRG